MFMFVVTTSLWIQSAFFQDTEDCLRELTIHELNINDFNAGEVMTCFSLIEQEKAGSVYKCT